jgi:hypothetical protein
LVRAYESPIPIRRHRRDNCCCACFLLGLCVSVHFSDETLKTMGESVDGGGGKEKGRISEMCGTNPCRISARLPRYIFIRPRASTCMIRVQHLSEVHKPDLNTTSVVFLAVRDANSKPDGTIDRRVRGGPVQRNSFESATDVYLMLVKTGALIICATFTKYFAFPRTYELNQFNQRLPSNHVSQS